MIVGLTKVTRWHILTAIGGYIAVAVVDLITTDKIQKDPTHLLAWPVPVAAAYMSKFTKPVKQD